MKEFIFYSLEGTTYDPCGEEVENCQLLGQASGKTKSEALHNLLKEHPWITEHHFNEYEIMGRELAHCENAC